MLPRDALQRRESRIRRSARPASAARVSPLQPGETLRRRPGSARLIPCPATWPSITSSQCRHQA